MKLLTKVGDTMLAKLIPGLDAKANCGQCRHQYTDCTGYCRDRHGYWHYRRVAIDLCGRRCITCLWDSLYICKV